MIADGEPTTAVDRAGAVASTLCAAHCAVCAFLPALFGALGATWLLDHRAEWAFTLMAAALGATALAWSWRSNRSPLIATLMALGVGGLLFARMLEAGGGHHDHHGHHEESAHHDDADLHGDGHDGDHHADAHDEHARSEGAHGHEETEQLGDDHEAEGHDDAHAAGAAVGVAAGALLVLGHGLNLRASRRRKTCADASCDGVNCGTRGAA